MYWFFNVLFARDVRQQLQFFVLYSRRLVSLTICWCHYKGIAFSLVTMYLVTPKCLLPEFKSAATHLTDLDVVHCMRLHVL